MCNPSEITKYGSKPVNIQWSVVRGDSASITIEFLEIDELTHFDSYGWTYKATAYDPLTDVLDELIVEVTSVSPSDADSVGHIVTITAPASVTLNWGSTYKSVVSELLFDLQVNIPKMGENTIWTPVIGTICVLGDVSPGGSL